MYTCTYCMAYDCKKNNLKNFVNKDKENVAATC